MSGRPTMISTAAKNLSMELFSDGDLRTLKELLNESVRPKLSPAVAAFIESVEVILENKPVQEGSVASTTGKHAQSGTLKVAVEDYIKRHPGREIAISSAAQEISETQGLNNGSVIAAFKRFRSGYFAIGGGKIEGGHGTVKFVPVGQVAIRTQPAPVKAGTVQQRQILGGETALTKLPRDVAFSYVLKYAIIGLPQPQQERIVEYASRILGKKPAGDTYSYKRLRAFEIFADMVNRNGETDKLFSALERLDTNNTDAVFDFVSSLQEPQKKQPAKEKPEPVISSPQKKSAAVSNAALNRPALYFQPQPVPQGEPQSAKYCLSCLETAIKNLGHGEQDAVRSYANRLLYGDSGQTELQQKSDPRRNRKFSVFVDSFAEIVKSGGLPDGFYEVLANFGANESDRMEEFNTQLCCAKNPYELVVAASKFAQSRYAQRVKSIDDIYREDKELLPIFSGRDGFHSETVSMRNQIPVLRIGQFYDTIKKIPTSVTWGNRYDDLLRLVRNSPANAIKFVEWASAQQNMDGAKFDLELQKYTYTSARVYS
ncbi:MAG: hypothetical protein V1836_04040 [Candidatus Aenigmatarchaeota archaeon]